MTDPTNHPTRTRQWVRPLGFAAAAAVVVILAIGPLALLGGDGDVIEEPSTTLSSVTTAPAPAPSTVPTTTPSTTATTVPVGAGGLVIANGETVTWGEGDGTLGVDVPAKVVFDDLAGGIVYQLWLPMVGDTGDSTIYHLPAGATEPRVLMAPSGSNWEVLEDLVRVDGSPTALVVERREPTSFENATDVLFEVDLVTGEAREVAVVGGWESGLSAISWDGSVYVTSSYAEAYTFLNGLDRDGTLAPWEGTLPAECFDDSSCPAKVVASGDGERLVMLRRGSLVEWDRATDGGVQSIDLPGGIYIAPILSGDMVVLNQYSEGFASDFGVALIVDLATGAVTEAPYAGFADWIDGPAIDVGPVDTGVPVDSAPALVIDGVEQPVASACAGADGALVFIFDDGRRAMVGFEDGTFIRYIDADGNVYETADVGVDESLPPVYSGVVDVDGSPLEITIVATSGVGLPECTP